LTVTVRSDEMAGPAVAPIKIAVDVDGTPIALMADGNGLAAGVLDEPAVVDYHHQGMYRQVSPP